MTDEERLARMGLKPGDEVELSYVDGDDGEPKLIGSRIIRADGEVVELPLAPPW
jgi:hypothetical protein